MKTLVLYGTKYGATAQIAEVLGDAMGDGTHVCNVTDKSVDLAAFDTVILGGSVYAGKLNKNTASFAQEHEDELLTKRLGLFTGGATPPGTKDYVEKLYPAALVRHASAIDILGGLFQADKINFVYKKIIASMRENDKTPGGFHEPTIDPAVIWAFANKMKATTADPTRKRDDHENLG